MLNNVRVVLVRTYHPGNIGSAARAMKTMGLTNLVLVNPLDFPSDEATKMAASADDVIKNATICGSVYEAVKDCSMVIASTARSRAYDLPELSPEESAKQLLLSAKNKKVALIFGPERMGLSNEDLQFAKYRVTIPTSPEYSSLNLAAAVQTLSYEVFKQYSASVSNQIENKREQPSIEQMEQYFIRLEETLQDSGFIIKNHPGQIMQKLRSLFARAQLDEVELNILHGILASYQRQNKKG